ncbi:MAG: DUF1376 domain-containing protein [Alphaproteobacteria bacterium]|nr:DUF1376 domain-containing protein [Alphaproteobacteria bacterium]
MAEFPALPVFTDAYLADTRHLTTEEHGAYLLLLMCAWRTRGCALRDEDRFLARTAGVSAYKWRKLRPVLADFFQIEEGYWRQKKLSEVYRNVGERVARNRANGAKGGRARAERDRQIRVAGAQVGQATAKANAMATKPKDQTPEPEAAASTPEGNIASEDGAEAAVPAVLAAAGLREGGSDISSVAEWLEAGACIRRDVMPVILRLRKRQQDKTGCVPHSLAYYTGAVLEARDKRLGALAKGREHAMQHPPPPEKRPFDPTEASDWVLFLGDAGNRFRGDYLSANWRIGADHPVFHPASLGPDPRVRFNALIPLNIREQYGPAWRWLKKRPTAAHVPKTRKRSEG